MSGTLACVIAADDANRRAIAAAIEGTSGHCVRVAVLRAAGFIFKALKIHPKAK